jgi:hypothetical protein
VRVRGSIQENTQRRRSEEETKSLRARVLSREVRVEAVSGYVAQYFTVIAQPLKIKKIKTKPKVE